MKVCGFIICAMIFAVGLFSSCNKNDESIVGKWDLQSVVREKINNDNSADVQIDTLTMAKTSKNHMIFKKNGQAIFTGVDLIENRVVYNEIFDWSVSDDNKVLYLVSGRSGEDVLDDREIEILSLSRKQLVTRAKNIEADSTYISTNTYKRF